MRLLVLVLGALAVGCTSASTSPSDAPSPTQGPPTTTVGPTTSASPAATPSLGDALRDAGAALASAPLSVTDALDLPACPTISSGPARDHGMLAAARDCFLEASLHRRPAALVVVMATIEGDPIVEAWITGPAGTTLATDHTRDTYGNLEWDERGCSSVGPSAGRLDHWGPALRCT